MHMLLPIGVDEMVDPLITGAYFQLQVQKRNVFFPFLRRLKTSLRNKMGEERLASLALMHTNYDVTIDPEMIVERFVRARGGGAGGAGGAIAPPPPPPPPKYRGGGAQPPLALPSGYE